MRVTLPITPPMFRFSYFVAGVTRDNHKICVNITVLCHVTSSYIWHRFGVSGVMVLQAFSCHGIHRIEHDDMFLYRNLLSVSYEISLSTSMAFIYPWRVLRSVSPMPGTGRIARGMLHGHLLDPLLPYFIFHICRVSGSSWLGPDPRQPYSRRNANTDPELSEVINLYLLRPRQRWNGSLALVSR